MALYRFVPDQTQQPYEKRRLLYFKLTVTIAPYQPYDEEIDRLLSMKLADLSTDPVVNDYQQASTLTQPLPAFGAVVQLSVTADAKDAGSPPDTYIMDVQPKQRTLYETVSETKEVASRSLEGLNVGKGSATTHSLEVVDVDHGGSAGVGYSGAQASFSRSYESGTKSLAKEDSSSLITSDESRERRETLSHTTQISQLYSLLQAYHVGTNCVMFLLAGRPHTVALPNGFVDGPRPLDGVQEFFFIVNQPSGFDFPCVGVRLDTSHLKNDPEKTYDTDAPSKLITVDTTSEGFDQTQTFPFTAPPGYVIDYYEVVTPPAEDGEDITVDAESGATSGSVKAFAPGISHTELTGLFGLGGDKFIGDAKRVAASYRVYFRSIAKTKVVRDRWALLLASRGMCCCSDGQHYYRSRLVDFLPMPYPMGNFPIAEAQQVAGLIQRETGRLFARVTHPSEKNLDGDLILDELSRTAVDMSLRSARLRRPVGEVLRLTPAQARRVDHANRVGRRPLRVVDLVTDPTGIIGQVSRAERREFRLRALGLLGTDRPLRTARTARPSA